MARKAFEHFEAVSAVIPGEGGYHAAIAVKAIGGTGAPRFNKVLEGADIQDRKRGRSGRRQRADPPQRRQRRHRPALVSYFFAPGRYILNNASGPSWK